MMLIGTGVIWVLSQIVKANLNGGTSMLLNLPWLQMHASIFLFSSMSMGVGVVLSTPQKVSLKWRK